MRNFHLAAMALLALVPHLAQAQSSDVVIDRNRVDRVRTTPAPDPARPVIETAATRVEAGDDAAPPIAGISFEGTEVPEVVARAAGRFVGVPATRATLQALVAAMSEAYGRSNVALFTIAIPEQDLRDGQVAVFIAEGHVEAVVLTGEVDGRALRLIRAYADRLTHERPSSRRVVERYLSLMRDVPGLKVDAELQMGEGEGGVRFILKLDQQSRDVALSFDSRTTQLFDDGQLQATGKLFGLAREGDETALVAASSLDLASFRYVAVSHSTPVGTDGMRVVANAGYLQTRPRGAALRGEARTAGITLSHPAIRSYRRNLVVSAGADILNSDNAALGSLISSERTVALRAAAGFSDVRERRSVTAGGAISKGLDVQGARAGALGGDTAFLKIGLNAGIDQALGTRAAARLRAAGQWSADRLPVAESFAVGGADYGRAFDTAILTADSGVAGLAELAWRPLATGALSRSELYAFADRADVRVERSGGGLRYDLASAGAGLRLAWKENAALSIEGAHALDRPFAEYREKWRVSVAWRLSLKR